LVTLVTRQLDEFKRQIKEQENRTNRFGEIGLALLGILYAGLAIIVTNNLNTAANIWTFSALALSLLAIMIAARK
jgi:hypothetical protein